MLIAGGLCVLMAIIFDLLLLVLQTLLLPWRGAEAGARSDRGRFMDHFRRTAT